MKLTLSICALFAVLLGILVSSCSLCDSGSCGGGQVPQCENQGGHCSEPAAQCSAMGGHLSPQPLCGDVSISCCLPAAPDAGTD
jgi:hypothetical protein